jgi:hypothetical protein
MNNNLLKSTSRSRHHWSVAFLLSVLFISVGFLSMLACSLYFPHTLRDYNNDNDDFSFLLFFSFLFFSSSSSSSSSFLRPFVRSFVCSFVRSVFFPRRLVLIAKRQNLSRCIYTCVCMCVCVCVCSSCTPCHYCQYAL